MAPRDQFPARQEGESPLEFTAITPDDNNDLPQMFAAIWVGTGGNLEIIDIKGVTTIIPNVPGSAYWVGSPVRIKNANTTAQGLVGAV